MSWRSNVTLEAIRASSTYIHETVHWWQHVGTTAGLMLSFLQPAHAHHNHSTLKEILRTHGPQKSLKDLSEKLIYAGRGDEKLNYVINNWNDLESFRRLAISPVELTEAVSKDPYFESVAHSYRIAIGSVSGLMASVLDPAYEVLPHPNSWQAEMDAARTNKVEGFYYGSPISVPPLGLREILEGQARFCQIQYLQGAADGQLSWQDLKTQGMLRGVYLKAFAVFIEFCQLEEPDDASDPVIAMFLLVCDIALNPSEGLLFPINGIESLVYSTDPGWRFVFLCTIIKKLGKPFAQSIKHCNAEEYWKTSSKLCQEILSPSPKAIAEKIHQWTQDKLRWKTLLEEDSSFNHSDSNFPIRVLLGRYLRFQTDKLQHPEFFCWPGVQLTGYRRTLPESTVEALFSEHQGLFITKPDMDVYPRLVPGRTEANLQALLDKFYSWVSVYEMTRQWIVEHGDFRYEYGWLTSKFPHEKIKDWADHYFQQSFGVHPDSFSIQQEAGG